MARNLTVLRKNFKPLIKILYMPIEVIYMFKVWKAQNASQDLQL